MIETVRYLLIPLTPVHIGTGETAGPEEYFLHNNLLVRFRPAEVFASWSDKQRQEYEACLAAHKVDDALNRIRASAGKLKSSHWYHCELADSARSALMNAIAKPEQAKGEIRPLPRNPYTGSVVIPGSAIKGAFRMAALNSLLASREDLCRQAKREVLRARDAAARGDHSQARRLLEQLDQALQKALFRNGGGIERDPFRFLKVSDATPCRAPGQPADRIDLAQVVWADGAARQGPMMAVERLRSRADGDEAAFELEISIDHGRMNHPHVGDPKRIGVPWPVDRAWLMQTANFFFLTRFQEEQRRFLKYYPEKAASAASPPREGCLLRLGRYSHFESLSLEGARLAYNRQKKKWITQGSTRTVCELAGGGHSVFGWVLLEPRS
ncbi:MAG: type III-A CRISPR-associated RAMP protein Csm5 [Bryobacteraceae bacterium]|nr:type III-A CRISPR-associated RAMP protein Csm5 [Bryobacteraceae bacterium]